MEKKILHIIPNSSLAETIKVMTPELDWGSKADIAAFNCKFNEGYVPRDFGKDEIDWLISNTPEYERELARNFFDFIGTVDSSQYSEVVVWTENHTSSLMLLYMMCKVFENKTISVAFEKRLYELASSFAFGEKYKKRVYLSEKERIKAAQKWDKESWHRAGYWVAKDWDIVEISASEIRNEVLKHVRTNRFTSCARVVGDCLLHSHENQYFAIGVWLSIIVDMIHENILDVKQNKTKKEINESISGEHIYAPNGVDISDMNIFSLRKIE